MPKPLAGQHFPCERELLPRTKLAYVNLPRLLSDAKRDRSARVSAYVGIWLPECLILLYLRAGELANASMDDGRGRSVVSLADALARVPSEPEYGHICYHQASADLLRYMFTSQTSKPRAISAPGGNDLLADRLRQLRDMLFTGLLELTLDGDVSYVEFESGEAVRGALSCSGERSFTERVGKAVSDRAVARGRVRVYDLLPELPTQAQPQLIQAYRDLVEATVEGLTGSGRSSAAAIAEHARRLLVAQHPSLEGFSPGSDRRRDPITTPEEVTRGVAAWITETIWTGLDIESAAPEELLKACIRERRHMFQSAGFFEHIPWKLEW